MERRHLDSAFVGGAYVFPGGRVDPGDAVDPAVCMGPDEGLARERLGLAVGALDHYVAAVRECFEEAGVLLAYDRSGSLLDFGDRAVDEHFRHLRQELNAGRLTLAEIVSREGLRLATDRLAYWSHWITPVGEPRRYDTRFFVAEAPTGQTAGHDDRELTSSAWVSPAEAIERAARREWMIIYPTLMNLRALARHNRVRDAITWANAQPLPLPANLPRVLGDRVVLPGDPGYDQAEGDVSRVDPAVFTRPLQP